MSFTRAMARERLRGLTGEAGTLLSAQDDAALDRTLDRVLEEISAALPSERVVTLEVTAGGRDIALPEPLVVRHVEQFPLSVPVARIEYTVDGATLRLARAPHADGQLRATCTGPHRLDDQGSTLSPVQVDLLVTGASAALVLEVGRGPGAVAERLLAEARARQMAFRQLLAHYGAGGRSRFAPARSRHVSPARATLG